MHFCGSGNTPFDLPARVGGSGVAEVAAILEGSDMSLSTLSNGYKVPINR